MSRKAPKGDKKLPNSRHFRGQEYHEPSDDDIDAFQMQREKVLLDEDSDTRTDEEFDEAVMNLPSDEDSQGDSEEDNWGRSKKAFYSADISAEDLQDEAREAKKLQKRHFSSLSEEDFGLSRPTALTSGSLTLNVSDSDVDSQPEEEKFEDKFATAEEVKELDSASLEELMPQEEKVALQAKYSPELRKFFDEFNTKLHEIRSTLEPVMKKFKGDTSKGLSFLETKYQLLLGYCANLAFYLLLKIEGKSVENHPVVERLVKYRLLIEKIKPMEAKLQYQIDKLVHAASAKKDTSHKLNEEDRELAFRPNLDMLAEASGDEINNIESDTDLGSGHDKLYKAPKIAPAHFGDGKKGNASNGIDKLEERERLLASNSRLLADLQAELGEEPEEETIDPVYGRSAAKLTSSKHREQYEEENFVRLTLTKKERRRLEKLQGKPVDELEDLNDFFKESPKTKNDGAKSGKGAINRLLGIKTLTGTKKSQVGGDDDVPAKRRQRASDGGNRPKVPISGDADSDDMSEIEDDMELEGEDDFYKSVKKMKMSKKNQSRHRGPAPNYRPIRDLSAGEQRPASYEMIKNKGLTPVRPKDVRNPRVRQRNKWERAQKRIKSFKSVAVDKKTPYSGESSGIRTNISRSVKF